MKPSYRLALAIGAVLLASLLLSSWLFRADSPEDLTLDEFRTELGDGNVEIAVALPAVQQTARPLEADVLIRLREPGGRTIERSLNLPVSLGQRRIGIKPLFGDASIGATR